MLLDQLCMDVYRITHHRHEKDPLVLMWELLGKGDAGELILYVESAGPSQRNRVLSREDETHQAEPSISS